MRTMRKRRLGIPVSGSARARCPQPTGRAGFTIVEVMVAVTVLVTFNPPVMVSPDNFTYCEPRA